jgi:hypothetical protein
MADNYRVNFDTGRVIYVTAMSGAHAERLAREEIALDNSDPSDTPDIDSVIRLPNWGSDES